MGIGERLVVICLGHPLLFATVMIIRVLALATCSF